jgi:DNA repair exonuclease SbcCD ATPase subunit
MRLESLEIQGFRGFSSHQALALDADAVVVIGANGQGKTTVCDAVLWALTGVIPRLGASGIEPLSLYSETGEVRVSLSMRSESHGSIQLARISSDGKQQIRIESDSEVKRGAEAEVALHRYLRGDATVREDEGPKLAATITRSIYLQQDLIRSFVDGETDRERFDAMSGLFGAGEVTELQDRLERARLVWSRNINSQEEELKELELRASRAQSELQEIGEAGEDRIAPTKEAWNVWWDETRRLGIDLEYVPPFGSAKARDVLDRGIRELQNDRRQLERSLGLAESVLNDIKNSTPREAIDLAALQAAEAEAVAQVEAARRALDDSRSKAAEERRKMTEQRDREEELRTLANLALRHLQERCPVCQQEYDVAATRRRLEGLIGQTPGEQASEIPGDRAVRESAAILEKEEGKLAETRAAIESAKSHARQEELKQAERIKVLEDLGVARSDDQTTQKSLETLIQRLRERIEANDRQEVAGETLLRSLGEAMELARRTELEANLKSLSIQIDKLEKELRVRRETGELASEIIEGLREAALESVRSELSRIEPVLERIWLTTDPHPSLRNVGFFTHIDRGKGKLRPTVADAEFKKKSDEPHTVLSSSQVNALAVSAFLALNLGIRNLPLDIVILDDPLQSLDDVNLLGVIDLLRRANDHRQLVICTHDEVFGELLARKLRPRKLGQRNLKIVLKGWSRQGPVVEQSDIPADEPLRLVG